MAISFTCPNCARHYRFNDELGGRWFICEKCTLRVQIPHTQLSADDTFAALEAALGNVAGAETESRGGEDDVHVDEVARAAVPSHSNRRPILPPGYSAGFASSSNDETAADVPDTEPKPPESHPDVPDTRSLHGSRTPTAWSGGVTEELELFDEDEDDEEPLEVVPSRPIPPPVSVEVLAAAAAAANAPQRVRTFGNNAAAVVLGLGLGGALLLGLGLLVTHLQRRRAAVDEVLVASDRVSSDDQGSSDSSPPQSSQSIAGMPPAVDLAVSGSSVSRDHGFGSLTTEPTAPSVEANATPPDEASSDTARAATRIVVRPKPASDVNREGDVSFWRAWPDPAAMEVTFNERRDVKLRMPRYPSGNDVLFPTVASHFVALGYNRTEQDLRIVFDMRTNRMFGAVTGVQLSKGRAAVSGNGLYFAAQPSSSDGLVVWDVPGKRRLGELPLDFGSLDYFDFAGGNRLVVMTDRTRLTTWALPSGSLEREAPLPPGISLKSIVPTAGGKYVVLIHDNDRTLSVIDLRTLEVAGQLAVPGSADGYLPVCRGLTFSPDGSELAGMFAAGSRELLLCWNMSNGQLSATHSFAQDLKAIVPGAANYVGRPLEWFHDGSMWLAYGHAVIDREIGGPIFSLPEDRSGLPIEARRIIDGKRAVGSGGPREFRQFVSLELPSDLIARGKQTVLSGGRFSDIHLPLLTNADWGDTRAVTLRGDVVDWTVAPDPAPASPISAPERVTIKPDGFTVARALLSRADAARAVVMFGNSLSAAGVANEPTFRNTPTTIQNLADPAAAVRIESYDLITTRKVGTLKLPFNVQLMAINPSGTQALVRPNSADDRLDVWEIDGGEHLVGWRPFADEAADHQWIASATFVDDRHVITINPANKLVLWEVPTCRAVYEITRVSNPALSAGGRYLTVHDGEAFRFFEAANGAPAGRLPTEGTPEAIAFDYDGRRLAAVCRQSDGSKMVVWNLEDASVDTEFMLPNAAASGATFLDFNRWMHWCGDDYLLYGNATLIDVESGLVAWRYSLPIGIHVVDSPDGRHWYLSAEAQRGATIYLQAADLPEPAAAAPLAERTLKHDGVLQPGARLRLEIQVESAPDSSELGGSLRRALTEQFNDNGVTIADAAPLMLSVELTFEETGKMLEFAIVEPDPTFPNVERERDVAIPETRIDCRVALSYNGNEIWEQSKSYNNDLIATTAGEPIPEGTTVEEFLAAKQWQFAADYLRTYSPPRYLFPPDAVEGLGVSRLDVSGVVTVEGAASP